MEEERVLASIAKQERILKGIEDEIAEARKVGDYIMGNMHEINGIINEVKSKKNPTKEDLKRLSDRIEILSINTKTKSIRIKTNGE